MRNYLFNAKKKNGLFNKFLNMILLDQMGNNLS